MTMQFEKKHLKQFKNQSQTGYMQSNELQTAGGEAGKKNRIKTQSQSGRSMVEMLGVLAIIAILSIGGIVMFRYAMNYYQANQIAHEMNIMRTDAQIKIAQGAEELMLGEPYDPISDSQLGHIQFNDDYPVDFACSLADDKDVILGVDCQVANAYYIELQNIPEGVCKPLSELVNGMSNIIAFNVNEKEYPDKGNCETGNGNVLNAVFSAEAVSELKACKGVEDCDESGSTPYCDPSRHVCVRCYEDNQCEHNQYCENNTCVTCESGVWNGEECVECTENDDCADISETPVCNRDTNKCVECLTYENCTDKTGTPQCDDESHTCKSCAEIDERTPVWGGTQCVECVNSTNCPETLVCKENTCSLCETEDECQEKGTDYHCSKEDTCIQCGANEVWDDKSKDCVECTADDHCSDTPATPKCNRTTNKCVECTAKTDCKNPNRPQCNTNTNKCVECLTYNDCKNDRMPQCDTNTNTCKSCPPKSVWYKDKCVPYECRSNEDCDDGKFCMTTVGYQDCEEFSPDPNASTFSGKCVDVNSEKAYLPTAKFYYSEHNMTWWSAERFCKALHKQMATRSLLDCDGYSDKYCTESDIEEKIVQDLKNAGKVTMVNQKSAEIHFFLEEIDECKVYHACYRNKFIRYNSNKGDTYLQALCKE